MIALSTCMKSPITIEFSAGCDEMAAAESETPDEQETSMSLRRWKDRMVARLLTRYPGLVKRWSGSRDFSAEMAGYRAKGRVHALDAAAEARERMQRRAGDDGWGEGENMTARQ